MLDTTDSNPQQRITISILYLSKMLAGYFCCNGRAIHSSLPKIAAVNFGN